jgi:AraC-like DNA-binding protein
MLDKQSGFPTLSVTARLFHMTPRTLHRRLREEGTSYQTILDEERRRLAVQYLQNSKFTIQEIAFNLGYTDPANFRRAFKRWENMTPSEYVKWQKQT